MKRYISISVLLFVTLVIGGAFADTGTGSAGTGTAAETKEEALPDSGGTSDRTNPMSFCDPDAPNCENIIPVCEQPVPGTTTGTGAVTSNPCSVLKNVYSFGGEDAARVPHFKKSEGSSGVNLEGGWATYQDFYRETIEKAKKVVDNYKDEESFLVKKTEGVSLFRDGERLKTFSIEFKTPEDAIAAGACQVTQTTPQFNSSYQSSYNRSLQSFYVNEKSARATDPTIYKVSKEPTAGATMVTPVRIFDTEHPFSPFHDGNEWRERQDTYQICHGSLAVNACGADLTEVCGKHTKLYTDDMVEAKPRRPWDDMGVDKGAVYCPLDTDGAMSLGGQCNYRYLGDAVDNGGILMCNQKRADTYNKNVPKYHQQCIVQCAPTYYPIFGGPSNPGAWGKAVAYCTAKVCCDMAQWRACRESVLPQVMGENMLSTSGISDVPKSIPSGVFRSEGSDGFDLRLDNDFGISKTFTDMDKFNHSLSQFNSFNDQGDEINFNGPFLARSYSLKASEYGAGFPAANALANSRSLYDMSPWNVGIDSGPNASITGDTLKGLPNASAAAYNNSGQHGAWNELVLRQAICITRFGLNCVCSESFLNQHNSINKALQHYSIQDMKIGPRYREEVGSIIGPEGDEIPDYVEKTVTLTGMTFQRPTSIDGKKFDAKLGHRQDGKDWTGDATDAVEEGLEKAKPGDIIYWSGDKSFTNMFDAKGRAPAAGIVLSNDGKGVQAKMYDYGHIFDSSGFTPMIGMGTDVYLAYDPSVGAEYAFNGKVDSCTYRNVSRCLEKQPKKWKVYDPTKDKSTCFDPHTGAECGDCTPDMDKLWDKIAQLNAEQTVVDPEDPNSAKNKIERAKEIQVEFNALRDRGCRPSGKMLTEMKNNMRISHGSGSSVPREYVPPRPTGSSFDNNTGHGGGGSSDPELDFSFIFDFFDFNFNFGGGGSGGSSGGGSGGGDDSDDDNSGGGGSEEEAPAEDDITPGDVVEEEVLPPGEIAAAFGEFLLEQTGADTPVYKEDCAGFDPFTGDARASPLEPLTSGCEANNYDSFGFLYAAFNNPQQEVAAAELFGSITPNTRTASPAEVVAYNQRSIPDVSEPNGCRITTLNTCGEIGDVVLIQSDISASGTDPYDIFLIYAGEGQFYEMTSSGGFRKSSLTPGYSSLSYEVRRVR